MVNKYKALDEVVPTYCMYTKEEGGELRNCVQIYGKEYIIKTN